MPPRPVAASAIAARADSSSVTSHAMASVPGPASFAACSSRSRRRASNATRAPRFASPMPMQRPSPLDAPTTTVRIVPPVTFERRCRGNLTCASHMDDLGTSNLRLERDGSIAWCTIDRPAARNALTPAMYFGIKRAVRLVNSDADLGALIITGTGEVFAPGGDLGGRSEPGESVPTGLIEEVLPFLAVRDSRAPVISAVNGLCQGGGLLIAMLSDIAVASDRAMFRVPELLRGIPDAFCAATLPAHVRVAVARDLMLSARTLRGAEAQRLGPI